MPRDALGEFEHLILLAILRLGDNAYGVPVIEELEARTGRSASQAAVYLTLKRLEKKGLISSRLCAPTPERGGRAKRFFTLNSEAKERLRETRAALVSMWDGVEPELDRP